MKPRLTYANVTSSIALFVALGGVSYAATTLPANSVGTTQLKDTAVINTKIKDSAITSAKIADSTITSQKLNADTIKFLKGQTGDRGAIGLTGPQGAKGDTGATGPAGRNGDQGIQGPQGIQGTAGRDGGLGDAYQLTPPEDPKFALGTATCDNNGAGNWHNCRLTSNSPVLLDMSGTEVPKGNYLMIRSQKSHTSGLQIFKDGVYEGQTFSGASTPLCQLRDAAGNTIEVLPDEDPSDGVAKPSLVTVKTTGRVRLTCSWDAPPTEFLYFLGGRVDGPRDVRMYAYTGVLSLIAIGNRNS